MFTSAQKIDIKSFQDYVFSDSENQSLLICDGIGSYEDSGKVAKLVVEECQKKNPKSDELESFLGELFLKIKEQNIIGGTTFILSLIHISEPTRPY